MEEQIIGIMGAIPQEVDGIIAILQDKTAVTLGNRTYYQGVLGKQKVVVVYSRIGKVAASATASALLLRFNVNEIIFIGVAGGIAPHIEVGDVIVARDLIQYDMDVSPLRPKYEIPLLNKTYFETNEMRSNQVIQHIEHFLSPDILSTKIAAQELDKFAIKQPRVYFGTIASGDQFFSTNQQKENLQQALPEVLCVEMEGAAVAQICYEYGVPCTVIRTISDKANQEASFSFESFVQQVSQVYGQEIIKQLFQ
ncbi:5'-methylthioadenosine/adenosylhomocysteine nucleosidase [Myroides odoratus]|uniref:adenosylhomocysteine nucleosidase n=1 Tax=Myroides odoratus TaxID=256 RepID=A0A9Q7E7Z4_MYROD|nr:5'-methylthioadenosine/adenosylhomocysteine nucleosidase [Myroides odoratus]EHQ42668.1 methylthioadenosine nucleosidase [Myroides odoratus DSM 2801]EKB07652.1 MTA/SAH nucleosidase [Myroides odoratus CIP 103059]QQU00031.1 5'-methylthioadenosine/adenosylhomocysteine nucleosidase [Myroides odoratus]WQD57750.1 5'-methylthioadenosine/adenosylhomocysteine nucleosidase [Myroides odoratus]STZ29929.1 MTA/SAH nucleosidase [Myroides odoratus]